MAKRRPDFIAKVVVGDGERARWREIGVGFWNEKRDTLNVLLDAVPVAGKIVLVPPKEREPGTEG